MRRADRCCSIMSRPRPSRLRCRLVQGHDGPHHNGAYMWAGKRRERADEWRARLRQLAAESAAALDGNAERLAGIGAEFLIVDDPTAPALEKAEREKP